MRNQQQIVAAKSPRGIVVRKRSGRAFTMSLLMFLITAFFILVSGSQLHRRLDDSLQTDTAFYHEGVDSLLFQAVYIRKESIVESEDFAQITRAGAGVVSYSNRCGSRLSNNSVVAVVYPNAEEQYTRRRITQLERRIELLSEASAFAESGGFDGAQIEAFSSRLSDVHLRMLRAISNGDYEEAAEYADTYLALQTKINLMRAAVAPEEIVGATIALQSRVMLHKSSITGNPRELRVPESGYFVRNADGYEETLLFDGSQNITAEQIRAVLENPALTVADNVVGKMVDNYIWRMAAVVPTNRVIGIARGMSVEVRIGAFPRELFVRVINVSDLGDGNTVIVFESDTLSEEFVRGRVTSVRLMLGTYSGLRVP
ncbi:MAG: hypothetical protein FWD35_06325, partial [Oscillospiraceae bacterium]|nr:hypothetical protein [Oscillospiraceae bacterium]